MGTANQVEGHYGRGHILDSIMRALHEMGKDIAKLTPADLALVDESTPEAGRRRSNSRGMQR
jgi:hypothetical protein